MPKLSLIQSEAERLVGRMPEARRDSLQRALLDLCEVHWAEVRGPEPHTPLAHALWSLAPPPADLLADLVAEGDGRLSALFGQKITHGFALLALAEIARGNAEGARLAHEPMMLFEVPEAGARYAEQVAASLRGGGATLHVHAHAEKPPLWKALAAVARQSGRTDLAAVVAAIGVLVAPRAPDAAPDPELEALRSRVAGTGVQFLGIDDSHVHLAVHGHALPPVHTRQLGEMLEELRRARRG